MLPVGTTKALRELPCSNKFVHTFDDEETKLIGVGRLKLNLIKPPYWQLTSWSWQGDTLYPWKLTTPFLRLCWLRRGIPLPTDDPRTTIDPVAMTNLMLNNHLRHHPDTPIRGDIEAAIVSHNQKFKTVMMEFVCLYGSS